ncbi:MAG: bifunctional adenosylcobinamide kinase/adenosylcobinamide-phosphate guanylyltransferase [Deltaproteobacteria bacterium]|nr:bifunctional adenosylcobinamide kinase/adenosylcobinamide-phosphate guanylyltransferase [Deltaproteobacteria bacterium]
MGKIVLITGGARSGKSSFALEEALKRPGKRIFIATALALDAEMKDRIRKHREERGEDFATIEEPLDINSRLTSLPKDVEVVVIDCLTVWLGNLFHKWDNNEKAVEQEVEKFCKGLTAIKRELILVTNEVGFGIVPDNHLARLYRDMLGFLNRTIAEQADNVYCCICGIPVCIKG